MLLSKPSLRISIPTFDIPKCGIEVLTFDLHTSRLNFIRFILVYRPPNTIFINSDSFCAFLHTVPTISAKQVVPLDDFNLPNIHWPNWSAPVGNASVFLFLDTFASLRLQQCVSFPSCALHTLHLILVPKEPSGISISHVFDVYLVANSNHTSILFNINCKSFIVSNKFCPQLPVASRFIFSKCKFEKAHYLLSNIDWNALLLPNLSTDILLQRFLDVSYNVIRATVPTTHLSISRSSPLPSYIRRLILAK